MGGVDLQTDTPGGGTPGGGTPTPAVWSREYWGKYWSVWVLLILWVIPLVVLLVWGLNGASPNPAVPAVCNPKPPDSTPASSPDNPAVLKARTTVNPGVPFGRDFGTRQRDIEYDVTANPDVLKGLYAAKRG